MNWVQVSLLVVAVFSLGLTLILFPRFQEGGLLAGRGVKQFCHRSGNRDL